MNLTKNFTLEELIASPDAKRLGINNVPTKTGETKLGLLAKNILHEKNDIH